MPAFWVSKCSSKDVSCEIHYTGDNHLSPWSGEMVELMMDISTLHAYIPLKSFTFIEIKPNEFEYKTLTRDLRQWKQVIQFDPNKKEPVLMLLVTDQWKMSEVTLHNTIRDRVIKMKKEHSIINISITW